MGCRLPRKTNLPGGWTKSYLFFLFLFLLLLMMLFSFFSTSACWYLRLKDTHLPENVHVFCCRIDYSLLKRSFGVCCFILYLKTNKKRSQLSCFHSFKQTKIKSVAGPSFCDLVWLQKWIGWVSVDLTSWKITFWLGGFRSTRPPEKSRFDWVDFGRPDLLKNHVLLVEEAGRRVWWWPPACPGSPSQVGAIQLRAVAGLHANSVQAPHYLLFWCTSAPAFPGDLQKRGKTSLFLTNK